ncbi:MAG TPA: hypothetical protein VHT03_06555 [Rhizomicrobium sp.]|jgi:hypothetical protein|nr:hypothetical protein [Rhizomicrobium sp.]
MLPAIQAMAAADNRIERYITNAPVVEAPPIGAFLASRALGRHSGKKLPVGVSVRDALA